MPVDTRIALLLDGLQEAYDRKSWHGPNLRGSLRGVTPEQALWRPAAGRHNIWEVMLHAAYWKYVARRRLTGEKRGSFVLKGSNFFPRDEGDAVLWRQELGLLDAEHAALMATVVAVSPAVLEGEIGTGLTRVALIRGAAAHDLYHAGQIQLLKRMMP